LVKGKEGMNSLSVIQLYEYVTVCIMIHWLSTTPMTELVGGDMNPAVTRDCNLVSTYWKVLFRKFRQFCWVRTNIESGNGVRDLSCLLWETFCAYLVVPLQEDKVELVDSNLIQQLNHTEVYIWVKSSIMKPEYETEPKMYHTTTAPTEQQICNYNFNSHRLQKNHIYRFSPDLVSYELL